MTKIPPANATRPRRSNLACRRSNASALALLIAMGSVAAGPLWAAPGAAPLHDAALSRASADWSARLVDQAIAGILRVGVSYARLVADVTYGTLTVDTERGGAVLRDLSVTLPGQKNCRVTVGRLALPSASLLPAERDSWRLDAADISVATACFGSNSAMITGLIGRDRLTISDLTVDGDSITGSGAIGLAFTATSPDLFRIEGSASFDYFAISAPGLMAALSKEISGVPAEPYDYDSYDSSHDSTGDPAEEAARAAEAAAEAAEAAAQAASEAAKAPADTVGSPAQQAADAGDAQTSTRTDEHAAHDDADMGHDDMETHGDNSPPAEIGLRGTLRAAHITIEDRGLLARVKPILPPRVTDPDQLRAGLAPLPDETGPAATAKTAFAEAAARFVADGGRITAEIRPAQPVVFDTTTWKDPDDALTLMQPGFVNAGPSPSVTLLAAPVGTGASDAKTLGLALARGTGIPQNRRAAIATLTPLANDPEVALALAELRLTDDPLAAYGQALAASAAGAPGAAAVLDAMEAGLSTEQILRVQPPADVALPDTAFASVLALREAALDAENGTRAPRSYGRALRLALPAAAAGDVSARALIDRMDARFGADAGWRTLRDGVSDIAMADWKRMNLSKTLSTR